MRVPISRPLAGSILLPFLGVLLASAFDLFKNGEVRLPIHIIAFVLFGIPGLILTWLLLDKRVEFLEIYKVRKKDRIFIVPFTSSFSLRVLEISTVVFVGGLAIIILDKDQSTGLPFALAGASVFVFACICHEHPRIWLKDTRNREDERENIL